MPDRIVTATSADGSFSIVAGVTTDVIRECRRRHDFSPTATAATGRLATAAALLGASLKGREKLTLQVAGNGPVRGIVADVSLVEPDRIGARAYAREPLADVPLNVRGKFDVGRVVGSGVLQVTRSFEVGQPYVGIVPLVTGEIGDDVAGYLMTSEQIPSVVALGVLADPGGIVAAGGIIAQALPSADERTIDALEARATAMAPVTTQIAEGAGAEELARALGGQGVRFTRAYDLVFACTCSLDRVERALLGLGRDELEKILREQPQTEAICEFCKATYVLSHDEVRGLIGRLEAREPG